MIYTPTPRGALGNSHPETTPVLAQIQYAGITTTSVSDRGAAALFEMSTVVALPFGDLGATRHTGELPLISKQEKIIPTLDVRRIVPYVICSPV